MSKNVLVDLGAVSKPATVLIEKISEAVGGIAKPWQTKRTAAAEAAADLIRAKARIEITEIEERALSRLIKEEGRRQENIERISYLAADELDSSASPDKINNDWINFLFSKARDVSNEEMQSVWARVLAGEAKCSGSFSKRTLELVSCMDRNDAETFTKFCSSLWLFEDEYRPIIFVDKTDNRNVHGLDIEFSDLIHLQGIGLIEMEPLGFVTYYYHPDPILSHFEAGMQVTARTLSDGRYQLDTGNCFLTRSGRELAVISGAKPKLQYIDEIIAAFIRRGFTPNCSLDSKMHWKAL